MTSFCKIHLCHNCHRTLAAGDKKIINRQISQKSYVLDSKKTRKYYLPSVLSTIFTTVSSKESCTSHLESTIKFSNADTNFFDKQRTSSSTESVGLLMKVALIQKMKEASSAVIMATRLENNWIHDVSVCKKECIALRSFVIG